MKTLATFTVNLLVKDDTNEDTLEAMCKWMEIVNIRNLIQTTIKPKIKLTWEDKVQVQVEE
jgi:hypothetical protein